MNTTLRLSLFIICAAPCLYANANPDNSIDVNDSYLNNSAAFQENFDIIMNGGQQQTLSFTDNPSLALQKYLQHYIEHLKESHNQHELLKIETILKNQYQSLIQRKSHIQGLVHYIALKKFSDLRCGIIAGGLIAGIQGCMAALMGKALQASEYHYELERLLRNNNLLKERSIQKASFFSKTSDTGPEIIQSIKDILASQKEDSQVIKKVAMVSLSLLGIAGLAMMLEKIFQDYESELTTIDLKMKYIDHLLSLIENT